jgi:hypothetical protein
MNIMEVLQPSAFVPKQTARKVTFKSAEDIRADELAKLEKEAVQKQLKTNAQYRMRLSRWRKEKVKAEKRVERCQWFLNEAQKALKGVEDAKPIPPDIGIPVFTELASLYVEQKEKVSRSS